MSLPRRTHFSVFEVMARWGVTITDMRYYLEAGQLQAQVILEDKLAQVYHRVETPDKEEAWIKKSIITLNGYVVVQSEQLRKIFRLKSAPVYKFKAIEGSSYYKLLREKDITPISVDDLWISTVECTRFEREHEIMARFGGENPANGSKTGIAAMSAGRPSIMNRITERHRERVTNGESLPTMNPCRAYRSHQSKRSRINSPSPLPDNPQIIPKCSRYSDRT